MTTEPEPTTSDDAASDGAGDDYGYDLAHEVKDALQIPVTRRRGPSAPRGSGSRVPEAPSAGSGRPPEQDGDLGYDDAHEIRGS